MDSKSPNVPRGGSVGQGGLPLMEFLERVKEEIRDATKRAVPGGEPLGIEIHATEMAKRIVAYTAEVMIQKELANLRSRQQHLELLANMVIDVYAIDSAVAARRSCCRAGVPTQREWSVTSRTCSWRRQTSGFRMPRAVCLPTSASARSSEAISPWSNYFSPSFPYEP
jgi:hypothetical protein